MKLAMQALVATLVLAGSAPCAAPPVLGRFVDAAGAWSLLGQQAAVLDARTAAAYRKGHIAGARLVAWDAFSDTSAPLAKGLLSSDRELLGRLLGALGVRGDRPVLVYGDPLAGWGEEGRIAWMLEHLGHRDVHVLDGGVNAWTAAGGTLTRDVPPPATGKFEILPVPAVSAAVAEVQRVSASGGAILLDTRTPDEYRGATWYGAPRGGHIPRAQLFPWQQLLDPAGKLLPVERIRTLVAPAGSPVIAYCTGGVRSGFVYWALAHAGVASVKNYPGSWWEWSGRRDLPVEKD
ncbi:MAG: sulfurtransferase [Candidatus Wallbacteria bacterium]|nr:sulfurtransferase [Candidatus Wallbacteria bacterium]